MGGIITGETLYSRGEKTFFTAVKSTSGFFFGEGGFNVTPVAAAARSGE